MKGEMQKSIRMPEKGKWMVRLSPEKKAVAYVTVEHILAFHSKVDVLELDHIIAQATIDNLGYFRFQIDLLGDGDQLYRVHFVKQGDPPATLIIGGSQYGSGTECRR